MGHVVSEQINHCITAGYDSCCAATKGKIHVLCC